MIPSMSRPANPYNNASCEGFLKTLKREEIFANDYVLDHLRRNIVHLTVLQSGSLRSALSYHPPEEFEGQLKSATTFAAATMSFSGMRRTIDPIQWRGSPQNVVSNLCPEITAQH